MTLRIITAPETEPVTTSQVKLDAHVDEVEFDARIDVLIPAFRKKAESITGRALITQTWDLVLSGFPPGDIQIGMLPIQSITSVKYYDTDNAQQTVSADDYSLDTDVIPGFVRLNSDSSWPSSFTRHDAVIVRFIAGYGDASDVPNEFKIWIRANAATLVDVESNIVTSGAVPKELPRDFTDGLIDAYRLWFF